MSTTATTPTASAPTGSSPAISLAAILSPSPVSPSPAPDASRAASPSVVAPETETHAPSRSEALPAGGYTAEDLDSIATSGSLDDIASLLLRGSSTAGGEADPATATTTTTPTDDPTRSEAAAAAEDALAPDDEELEARNEDDTDETIAAEADADAAEETPTEEGEALPAAFQKRLDKLTAIKERFKTERDEARQQIDELRAQLDDRPALAPVVLPVSPADPLADLTTEQAVQERLTMAQQVIAWADAHPDGGEITDAQGEPHYFTAQQVAERRLKAQKLAEIDVPKRLAYLRDQRAAVQTAQQIYPDLFVADSFMARQADQFISAIPGITAHPLYPLFVADWVVGAAARAGHYRLVPVSAASPAAPGTPAKPAPVQGSPASTAPATPAASLPPPTPAAASATPPRRPRAATQSAQIDAYLAKGADSVDELARLLLARQAA